MAHRLSIFERDSALSGQLPNYNSGTLVWRTGTQPASTVSSPTGTSLVTIALTNPAFSAPTNGAMANAATWSGTGHATGEPGWGRFQTSAGTVLRDIAASDVSFIGLVADEILDGQVVFVTSATISQPGE